MGGFDHIPPILGHDVLLWAPRDSAGFSLLQLFSDCAIIILVVHLGLILVLGQSLRTRFFRVIDEKSTSRFSPCSFHARAEQAGQQRPS